MAVHRAAEKRKTFQRLLMSGAVRVDSACSFSFDTAPYPYNWAYDGAFKFEKHYHATVGELKRDGEEFECAAAIEQLGIVRHWIRNLSGQPRTSFWLPTSTDRFYPDFLLETIDGRIVVIEYKGEHFVDSKDTKEKVAVGQLWEAGSGGSRRFILATKDDLPRLAKLIG